MSGREVRKIQEQLGDEKYMIKMYHLNFSIKEKKKNLKKNKYNKDIQILKSHKLFMY